MNRQELEDFAWALRERLVRECPNDLYKFAIAMYSGFERTKFHKNYYKILQAFAEGKIKRLIITVPPQHGKSLGSSIMLPAYMLGKNPDLKIVVSSYSQAYARGFSRNTQSIIDTQLYYDMFPETRLSASLVSDTTGRGSLRKSDEFEIVGKRGGMYAAGTGSALTGRRVDVSIIDDLYKDSREANSPVVRKNNWSWYTDVVRKRQHNESQELIVFTRWHKEDLIGTIEEREKVVQFTDWAQLENFPKDVWLKVNFPAIKVGAPTAIDKRQSGEALWPARHSIEKLHGERSLDPNGFECLNQGNPIAASGLLYGDNFKTYRSTDEWGILLKKGSYTDVADTGTDYLCTMNYEVRKMKDNDSGEYLHYALITDILLTDEPTEITEDLVPEMLERGNVREAYIESNNGGRTFARIVAKKLKGASIKIKTFHQSGNKESRIVSNSSLVTNHIMMPERWDSLFPKAYSHITGFQRDFEANGTDDPEDVLTGIIEKEILPTIKNRTVRTLNPNKSRLPRQRY